MPQCQNSLNERPNTGFRTPGRYYARVRHVAWQTALSRAGADREAGLLVRRLRKQAGAELDRERRLLLKRIARSIAACRPNRRCRNAACPRCNRARQAWFVDQARHALSAKSGREKAGLATLSIIAGPRLAHGSIIRHIDEQVTRFATGLRRGITDAGIAWLIGGIDISANIDAPGPRSKKKAKGTEAVRYQLHLWAVGAEQEVRRAMPSLRKAFPNNRSTPRAVHHVKFDGAANGYAYALKPNFDRRFGILKTDDAEGAKVRRNTRSKPLTVPMHAEIAVILNRLGVHRRIFLKGFEVQRNAKSEATIVAQDLTSRTINGVNRRRDSEDLTISSSRGTLSTIKL